MNGRGDSTLHTLLIPQAALKQEKYILTKSYSNNIQGFRG